jgi:hypothetical protein
MRWQIAEPPSTRGLYVDYELVFTRSAELFDAETTEGPAPGGADPSS